MTSILFDNERSFLEAVSKLAFCNPFLPERTAYERLALGSDFVEGEPIWSMEVLSRYCTILYSKTMSYEEAARRIGIDRRTVKAKVDRELLEQLKRG